MSISGDSAHSHEQTYRREQAWALLTEWTQSESLRKHALAVEACVAAYGEQEADRLGLTGDDRAALIELYSTTALLHDFDYERHPTAEEHPFVGVRELERLGWAEAMRTAILGHAQYSGVARTSHLPRRFSPATSWPAFSLHAHSSSPPRPSPTWKLPA
jgi:predicted hydrolase (HD superfamily)